MSTKFGDEALVPHGVIDLGEVKETDAGDLPLGSFRKQRYWIMRDNCRDMLSLRRKPDCEG